jgi:hypothetical protein
MDKGDYAQEMAMLPDSINRALDQILLANVLSYKSKSVDAFKEDDENVFIRVNLDTIARDIFQIIKINYENEKGRYEDNINYDYESGRVILLPNQKHRKGKYIIVYERKFEVVTSYTPDIAELDIPDEVARFIPYFTKSELYEEDEPSASANALALFNSGLSKLAEHNQNTPTQYVESVYEMLMGRRCKW